MKNKKSLGQHWLKDRAVLTQIAEYARGGSQNDSSEKSPTILEIGPGLGTLTSVLLKLYGKVIAVEFDEKLAENLPKSFPGKDLTVINADILTFDLNTLPKGYVVVGNIPYYITSPIIKKFLTAKNKPKKAIFLVQKEVADRATATTGRHTVLSLTTQAYANVATGIEVKKSLFIPPPKVDSKVLILEPYETPKLSEDILDFIKLAFSNPRKKLIHNLSTALHLPRETILEAIKSLNIDENARPADLSPKNWQDLSAKVHTLS
jgi:16S rRNA (adenine1518-N6/adenine1519-N6)-dimethyltransferase